MADRNVIIAVVGRAARRLKLRQVLSDLATAGQMVLAAALIVELAAIVAPAARGLGLWIAGVGLAGVALARAARVARADAGDRAAAELDRAADLHDEIRTAHWFLGRESSGWLDLVIRRAAASAATLDVRRLVPIGAPRRQAGVAALLAAAVVGASLLPLDRAGAWLRAGGAARLTAEEQARLDRVERLLREMAADEDQARRDEIEALLEKLRDPTLTAEERLAIVSELRRLVGEHDDDAAWREAMALAAGALAGEAVTEPVGEALGAEALGEASAEMRALAEAMAADQADAARRALERAAREAGEAGGEFAQSLGEAAAALEAGDLDRARAALQQAAGALDEKAGLGEREELGRQADQQLAELERAFGERFRTPGEAEQAVTRAERQALESDDASPEGAVPMEGEGQGKAVPGSGDEKAGTAEGRGDLPGPRTPSNSKATGAIQPLGDQVRRRQELLAAGKATGEAPGRDEVDEDTRASRVTVDYQPTEPRAAYADADRMTGDVVPWSYRSLVRTYFQIVGPRGSSR